MKKNFLLFVFAFGSLFANAQNIILKQDVEKDFEDSDYGPNKKHYRSTYTNLGFIFGNPDAPGSSVNWYKSIYYETGNRTKRQYGQFYALGRETSFNIRNYSIAQKDGKTFGGFEKHKSEDLLLINLNLTIYNRFNFKPHRGDHLGKYIDLAGYLEYTPIARHITRDKIDSQSGYSQGNTWLHGLKYLNRFNYGVQIRLGLGGISFFGMYRISNMFKKTTQISYVELPRYTAGISFDIPVKKNER